MLGFKKIKIRENSMFCDFKEKKGDKYYTSKVFDFFLKYLKENKNKSSLNISKNNLQISFNDIFSTKDAFFLLKYFSKKIQ